jgi:hypothetical protein
MFETNLRQWKEQVAYSQGYDCGFRAGFLEGTQSGYAEGYDDATRTMFVKEVTA